MRGLETEEADLVERIGQAAAAPVVELPAYYEAVYREAVDGVGAHLAYAGSGGSREGVRIRINSVVAHEGNAQGEKKSRIDLRRNLFSRLQFAANAVGATVKA